MDFLVLHVVPFLQSLQHRHKENYILQKESRASLVFPRVFLNHFMVHGQTCLPVVT